MRKVRDLKLVPVWLAPGQWMQTAKILMAGHKLRALAVVDAHRQLLGMLSADVISSQADDAQVEKFVDSAPMILSADEAVRSAADRFAQERVDYAAVLDGNQFLGTITAIDLLAGLRESYDPLTELPWSDALRDWGVNTLSNGQEIAVIFVDINRFGDFNKRYGHVIGDRVLKIMAQFLTSATDPKRDLVVRYGGDEFAIGTTRDRDDADELAAAIQGEARTIGLPDVADPIDFSVGIYGGRRSKERANTHVSATLDNLINLASRDCLSRKPGGADRLVPLAEEDTVKSSAAPVVAPMVLGEPLKAESVPQPRQDTPVEDGELPILVAIQAEESPNSLTHVVLRHQGVVSVGVGLRMGRPLLDSIAYATAKALERLNPGVQMHVDSVQVKPTELDANDRVMIDAKVLEGDEERQVLAETEASGEEDRAVAVATAVISAFYAR